MTNMGNKKEPTPLVLYFTREEKKAKQIELLCEQFGYAATPLKESEVDCAVGRLAGLPSGNMQIQSGEGVGANEIEHRQATQRAPALYQQPEVMIFSGIPDDGLDLFLKAYRIAGIAPIPLKAVLTVYNYTWSVYQLTQELIREHAAMMTGGEKR